MKKLGFQVSLMCWLKVMASLVVMATAGLWGLPSAIAGEDKPVVEEILDILKENNQITDEQYDHLMQKAKKEELEAQDFKTFWDNGFRFESADGEYKLKIGGRIMTDFAAINAEDDELNDAFPDLQGNGFEFRRARFFMSGTIHDWIIFKSQFDFAGGDVDFKDVYLGFTGMPGLGTLRIGHQKEPFSLEELTSSKYITFMERALPNAFSPGRNTGFGLSNAFFNDRVTYGLGFYKDVDDTGDAFTDFSDWNITGRLTGLPWYAAEDRLVHLGFSYSHQFRSGEDNPARFRARPESHITDERLVDTGEFPVDDVDLINPELAFVFGPFSLQGEYFHSFVSGAEGEEGGLEDDPSFNGYYIYASYFLTGEHRSYDPGDGAFGRVKPRLNFNPWKGGWGAWEVGFRYSYLDLTDEGLLGGEENNYTFGLNWYMASNVRTMFNYVRAHVEDSEKLEDDGDANIFQTRFQIDF